MIEKIGNFNFFCLLFLSMMLMHLFCDFNLQGILAEMKQKRWWRKQTSEKMYENDWMVALLVHSFVWSLFMLMPAIAFGMFLYMPWVAVLLVVNTAIHFMVDHEKANHHSINLVADQFWHFLQVLATAISCHIVLTI